MGEWICLQGFTRYETVGSRQKKKLSKDFWYCCCSFTLKETPTSTLLTESAKTCECDIYSFLKCLTPWPPLPIQLCTLVSESINQQAKRKRKRRREFYAALNSFYYLNQLPRFSLGSSFPTVVPPNCFKTPPRSPPHTNTPHNHQSGAKNTPARLGRCHRPATLCIFHNKPYKIL